MKVVDDFVWRQREQIIEAVSEVNRWFAGVAVGHDPTVRECLSHYVRNGGAADFARREAEKFRQSEMVEI